jgi:oligopeptidase B
VYFTCRYLTGKLLQKKHTFEDFVTVANYLVKSGMTSSDKMSGTGTSAGGLMMGASLNLNPALFKAVLLRVMRWEC